MEKINGSNFDQIGVEFQLLMPSPSSEISENVGFSFRRTVFSGLVSNSSLGMELRSAMVFEVEIIHVIPSSSMPELSESCGMHRMFLHIGHFWT